MELVVGIAVVVGVGCANWATPKDALDVGCTRGVRACRAHIKRSIAFKEDVDSYAISDCVALRCAGIAVVAG